MNRETLREDIRSGDGYIPEPKGNNRWKRFSDHFANSAYLQDIAKTICQCPKMSSHIFDDRLEHVPDNPLLIPFHKAAIEVSINKRGYEPRHVDLALLAVDRCMGITGSKDIESIKADLSKSVKKQEQKMIMQRSCYARS